MIVINDEAALRVKCEDALPDEVGPIIEQLERELDHSAKMGRQGIGLAAIQCGIPKNIAIVRIDSRYKFDLVNCEISNAYDEFIFRDEGCLSFPGKFEDTRRFQEIHITCNAVFPNSFILTGLPAIVAQHELDHLSGKLLPDFAIPKQKRNKLGPNDLCNCGKIDPMTGKAKKYKRCCGK